MNVKYCIACMEDDHKRHDWTNIEKEYFSAECRLNSFVDELSKSSMPQIQNDILSLKQKLDSCNEKFENVHTELDAAETKWKHGVTQSFQMLHKDLTEMQVKCALKIQEEIEELEGHLKVTENLIASTEGKIRAGGLHLIECFPKHPSISVCHSDVTIPIPRFILNDEALNKSEFGKLIKENRNEAVELICSFEIALFGGRIEPVNGNSAWVGCHEDGIMYCYDSDGQIVTSISVSESDGIRDFAVMKNGDIVVSCVDKKIRCIPMYGKTTVLIDAKQYTPRGICLTGRQEIVVCLTDGQGTKHHLAVFSSDGKKRVRRLRPKDGNYKELDIFPFRVDLIKEENGADQMIVIDDFSRLLSIDSQNGRVIWLYDGSQVKQSKTDFNPVRVCKDKLSNLLVTDSFNDCIHLIDKRGTLIRVIMMNELGLQQPWGIGVDNQNDRIWCGSRDSKKVLIIRLSM